VSRRRVVKAVLGVSCLGLLAPLARAHAGLERSEPARRATLRKAPKKIRLWFNERLEPAYASIKLYGEDGEKSIETPKAVVNATDPKLLEMELPPLPPGQYTVKYRVLSVDGHTVDYGYVFTIKP
jgi:Uncharacterized protein, homolog of Cu resistance protein CopC